MDEVTSQRVGFTGSWLTFWLDCQVSGQWVRKQAKGWDC